MTTDGTRCSQIMRQKSPNVSGSGPYSSNDVINRHEIHYTNNE